ncbi:unnamed protein product, partial [Musa acuminata subsp. burmannicoides]
LTWLPIHQTLLFLYHLRILRQLVSDKGLERDERPTLYCIPLCQ